MLIEHRDGVGVNESTCTAADALIEGLLDAGVTHLFVNFGSDHPDIIEALARLRALGRNSPRVIVCPYESVALSAAHGHALVSRQAQAVFVHCDVGTQTLGGAVHNVSRARVPAFIFAGETPFTIDGELFGGRNRPVQTLQDVHDQHGIVRSYVKWSAPLKTGQNARQMVYRAMQLAHSEPAGPVYLSGAREYLAEQVPKGRGSEASRWPVLEPTGLADDLAREIVTALADAERPLLITSYAGRDPRAVAAMVRLCEALAVPVVEASRSVVNFPADHPLHLGYASEPLVEEADTILVVDCDSPWDGSACSPRDDALVFHVDVDPLKANLVLWHTPATRCCQAHAALALTQLSERAANTRIDARVLDERRRRAGERHAAQRRQWAGQEAAPEDGTLTPALLTACLRGLVDEDTIVVDETITSFAAVCQHLPRTRAGTYFTSGGSSLGWHGGAAIGIKLAAPERTVVSLTGDGSYYFSVPSAVHWTARRYATPFLTVIYNNGGWNATRLNTLSLYPQGTAQQTDHFWVNLEQRADLAGIAAAAGGALARTVTSADQLEAALADGLAAVGAGRAAVVEVRLPPISRQAD